MKHLGTLQLVGAAIAAIALGCGSPAAAQGEEISIPSSQDWQHDWTEMAFPARIGGFDRDRLIQYEGQQTNISANYYDAAAGTILTIYIYRPLVADTSIWFDRALMAIGVRELYGNSDLKDMKVGSFVPSGGTSASGQYAAIKAKGRFRSTGVALYNAGEWLVKIRISSGKMGPEELEAEMLQRLSDLPAMNDVSQEQSYLIEQCSTELSFDDEAELSKKDLMTDAILFGGLMAAGKEEKTTEKQAPYCRQGERAQQYNLYTRSNVEDGYVLGLGDAGFSISVTPATLAALLSDDKPPKPEYYVINGTGLETKLFAKFSGLPNPGLAANAVFEGSPIGAVNRPFADEGTNVNISSSILGEEEE